MTPAIYALTLSWTAPLKDTSGKLLVGPVYFNVYRDISGTLAYSKLNPSPLTTPSYFDDTLVKSKEYTYQVTAWQLTTDKESVYSNKAVSPIIK